MNHLRHWLCLMKFAAAVQGIVWWVHTQVNSSDVVETKSTVSDLWTLPLAGRDCQSWPCRMLIDAARFCLICKGVLGTVQVAYE